MYSTTWSRDNPRRQLPSPIDLPLRNPELQKHYLCTNLFSTWLILKPGQMKFLNRVLLVYPIFFIASCGNRHANLYIQNLSEKDSLRTVVLLNGDQIFDGSVQRPDAFADGTVQPFRNKLDLVHIKVEIPILGLTAIADSTVSGLKSVYIVIQSKHILIDLRSDTGPADQIVRRP